MRTLAFTAVFAVAATAHAQDVFTGLDTEYIHEGFADINLPENQDRITGNVWITRGVGQGIFNIAREPSFTGMGASSPSPIGTRWARGSAADYATLTFGTWGDVHESAPPLLVGEDLVVHLVEDDIYIDLRFTDWGAGAGLGGSFAYLRSAIQGPCNQADNAEPFGVLDLSDIQGFINAFTTADPAADLAAPFGVYDLADLSAFVTAFLDGCP